MRGDGSGGLPNHFPYVQELESLRCLDGLERITEAWLPYTPDWEPFYIWLTPLAATYVRARLQRIRHGCRQLQVLLGIPVADVLDESTEERVIIGDFPERDVLPNEIAKNAPEVFVAGVRHE